MKSTPCPSSTNTASSATTPRPGRATSTSRPLPLDFENAEIGDAWNNLFAQIQFGEMPPAKAEHHPGGPEKAAFLAWLDSELVAAGRGFGLEAKLLLPDYANYIDHETALRRQRRGDALHAGAAVAPATGDL